MTILIVICPIIVILCASNMVYCIYLNLSTHKYHSSIIIIIAFSDNNITMLRFIDATIFILGVSIREVLGSSSRAHPTKMSLVSEREREGGRVSCMELREQFHKLYLHTCRQCIFVGSVHAYMHVHAEQHYNVSTQQKCQCVKSLPSPSVFVTV